MPRPKGSGNRSELVQYAITGIDAQIQQLEAQIRELIDKKKQLTKGTFASVSTKASKASATGATVKKKRIVSAATRKKLKEAAKARWARARGEKVD